MPETSNPAGSPVIHDITPKPDRAPSEVVQQIQDPEQTEADFARDLDKATQRKPAAS
jgi:hypothetical protein